MPSFHQLVSSILLNKIFSIKSWLSGLFVATAYYRLLTEIRLKQDFYDEQAERLQSCFSPGVINLVADETARKKAVVVNPRLDLCSRQVFMHDEFKDLVEVYKVRDHFICKCAFGLFMRSLTTNRWKCGRCVVNNLMVIFKTKIGDFLSFRMFFLSLFMASGSEVMWRKKVDTLIYLSSFNRSIYRVLTVHILY